MPNRFYFRQFLNRPGHHAGAYLLASVEDTSRAGPDSDQAAWVEFVLADCHDRIGLEFPLWDARQRRNSVRKARLLLTAMQDFVDALEAEASLAAERNLTRYRRL